MGIFPHSLISPSFAERIVEFKHPELPHGCEHFPNFLLGGLKTKDWRRAVPGGIRGIMENPVLQRDHFVALGTGNGNAGNK